MRLTQLVVFTLVGALIAGGAAPLLAQASSERSDVVMVGDALEIRIWREDAMSGVFEIDQDGVVTLPLLGRLVVAGMSVAALRDTLQVRYERDLREPIITVSHLRRVYVLGHVRQPGLLSVTPTITLSGAVALAGGATDGGDLRKLKIVRDGTVIAAGLDPESPISEVQLRSGDQIFVERRGWFSRNSTFVVSALLTVATMFAALSR